MFAVEFVLLDASSCDVDWGIMEGMFKGVKYASFAPFPRVGDSKAKLMLCAVSKEKSK